MQAIYDIGCLTGCIICGVTGQMLGRRMFIVIGGVLVLVGAGLQAGAHGTSYLISGRVVAGLGMGLNTTVSLESESRHHGKSGMLSVFLA